MAYFRCGSGGGNVVEIDGVEYDGDLKLKEKMYWIKLADLPCTFTEGTIVEYDGEINIIPNYSTSIYRKTENGWVERKTMPYSTYSDHAVIYKGDLFIRANKYLYMHNRVNDTWTSVYSGSYLPSSGSAGSILATDNGIYAFANSAPNSSGSNDACVVIYGSGNTASLPMAFNYSRMVYHEGNIHMLGSNANTTYKLKHYRFNESSKTWTSLGSLPCTVKDCPVISTKKGICIIANSQYYILIDGTWTTIGETPYESSGGSAIEYKDNIHRMGGNTTYYTYNNNTGTKVFPYASFEFMIDKKVYEIEE